LQCLLQCTATGSTAISSQQCTERPAHSKQARDPVRLTLNRATRSRD
jgi:hypothetical protein